MYLQSRLVSSAVMCHFKTLRITFSYRRRGHIRGTTMAVKLGMIG